MKAENCRKETHNAKQKVKKIQREAGKKVFFKAEKTVAVECTARKGFEVEMTT